LLASAAQFLLTNLRTITYVASSKHVTDSVCRRLITSKVFYFSVLHGGIRALFILQVGILLIVVLQLGVLRPMSQQGAPEANIYANTTTRNEI
jgi:hypothetical protein